MMRTRKSSAKAAGGAAAQGGKGEKFEFHENTPGIIVAERSYFAGLRGRLINEPARRIVAAAVDRGATGAPFLVLVGWLQEPDAGVYYAAPATVDALETMVAGACEVLGSFTAYVGLDEGEALGRIAPLLDAMAVPAGGTLQ